MLQSILILATMQVSSRARNRAVHNKREEKGIVLGVAGGGSGGHSIPLLAIADEFKKTLPRPDIFFVTTRKSVEERIIRDRGFPYYKIPSGKLNGQGKLTQLWTLLKMPFALLISAVLVLVRRPDVALSAGGYAGAPFIMAARLLGVRTVIYEQNRKPGMAIRLMSRFANLILLNYEAAQKNFPNNETAVVGLPCREEIANVRWTKDDPRWSEQGFRIFITGGSQGAMGLNRMLTGAMQLLGTAAKDFYIHHQTGKNDVEYVESEYRQLGLSDFKVEAFVHDMDKAYESAHLVICRSGASTLVELAAAGKAAILVPLVSKDNHQVPNAEECEEVGAAKVILQGEGADRQLADKLKELCADRSKIQNMAEAMATRYVPGATAKILAHLRNSH